VAFRHVAASIREPSTQRSVLCGVYSTLRARRARLPVETLSRLHRYRDYLNQTQPGIDANVSMAARMLLFRALDQVEEEMGIRKKAKVGLHDMVRGKK
jgi:hypothetical protein